MSSSHHEVIVGSAVDDRNRLARFDLMLFDLDGVLMDTRQVMRMAWREVQQIHEVEVPFEAYAAHLGRPFADILRCLGLKGRDMLAATYEAAATRAADLAKPFPGVRSALRNLASVGCLLGMVTSKARGRTVLMVTALGVDFVTVRTPEVGRGKPAPDHLLLAMADAGVDPANTVYIGDTAVDQQAARRAGVAYAHAGWGYGTPDEPHPVVLEMPPDLELLGGIEGGGAAR